jgi:hypothetical protein
VYANGGRTLVAHPGLQTVVDRSAGVASGLSAPGVRLLSVSPILEPVADGSFVETSPVDGATAVAMAVGTGAPAEEVRRWNPNANTNVRTPQTVTRPIRRLVVTGPLAGYATVKEVATLPDRLPSWQLI